MNPRAIPDSRSPARRHAPHPSRRARRATAPSARTKAGRRRQSGECGFEFSERHDGRIVVCSIRSRWFVLVKTTNDRKPQTANCKLPTAYGTRIAPPAAVVNIQSHGGGGHSRPLAASPMANPPTKPPSTPRPIARAFRPGRTPGVCWGRLAAVAPAPGAAPSTPCRVNRGIPERDTRHDHNRLGRTLLLEQRHGFKRVSSRQYSAKGARIMCELLNTERRRPESR